MIVFSSDLSVAELWTFLGAAGFPVLVLVVALAVLKEYMVAVAVVPHPVVVVGGRHWCRQVVLMVCPVNVEVFRKVLDRRVSQFRCVLVDYLVTRQWFRLRL